MYQDGELVLASMYWMASLYWDGKFVLGWQVCTDVSTY
jgi:hypothetical protein